jgi:hypothetical protein
VQLQMDRLLKAHTSILQELLCINMERYQMLERYVAGLSFHKKFSKNYKIKNC